MTEYGGMVLIRYMPDLFGHSIKANESERIYAWMDTLSYKVEWAVISNKRVGFFVTPEDATHFTLVFGTLA